MTYSIKQTLLTVLVTFVSLSSFAQSGGYKGMVHAAWMAQQEDFSFEVLTIHGKQFNPYFFVGLGAGVDVFKDFQKYDDDGHFEAETTEYSIPVFVDARMYLLKSRIAPYVDAKIGYAFSCDDGTGVYIAPEIGCKIGITSRFGINIAAQYLVNKGIAPTEENYNSVCVKFGVEF